MARYFATTAIAYVNDAPHVGHAYEVVTGDAICRWRRLVGDDVHYVTGTDEYGLKNQRAAESRGVDPLELADVNSARFRYAADVLGVAYDDFVRTTEDRHTRSVQRFLQAIFDNGFITKGTYEGLYCVACEAYYTEVECIEGNCPVHGRPVEPMVETNWFFRLSDFQDQLLAWYETHPEFVVPASRRNEVVGFVKAGLRDLSISRGTFTWGVPLPWDRSQVTWVWFDALPNYLTAAGYGSGDDSFGALWPADLHLIGKDIIRFHAVFWPAMLMAAGLELPRQVAAHGWLLVGGEKMSKTKLNQISPFDLVDDLGVDAVRYNLLRTTVFGSDGDISYEAMVARYNSDLANNLGNLLSRVTTVIDSKCGGLSPASRVDSPLAAMAAAAVEATASAWYALAPSEALEATWRLVRQTNAFLEEAEPWRGEPGPQTSGFLGDALEALRIITLLAQPAIPGACEEIWRRIGMAGSPSGCRLPDDAAWGRAPIGRTVVKVPPLFPRRMATSPASKK